MKKLYFIALLAVAFSAYAAHITPEQALARLQSDGPRKVAPQVARYQLIEQNAYNELYLFTTGEKGGGYVILPADDSAAPLLGYSDSGVLDLTNPNLAYWLEAYNREITADASNSSRRPMMRLSRPAIAPMTSTRWNQSAPYNELCPEQNGSRCVTGCVATAMAQVLKYHNYPVKGTGTHSYTWNGQTLSFDYASTTFDWDNMTDTYGSTSTDEEKNAVATLMYACGVAVDMSYSPTESGAVSRAMGTALLDYFGYDKGLQMLYRDYYGLSDWEDLVYSELNEGRPVLYGGQGSAGGHQFVCDGYSADGYFHFNWGWGGLSDGYFLLTALDPPSLGIGGGAGGFNYGQCIMTGVQPPTADNAEAYLLYCGGFSVSAVSVELGKDISFGNGFYNYGYFSTPAGTHIGIKVEPSDGSDPIYLSNTYAEIKPEYGFSALTTQLPATLASGTYTLTPVYQIPGRDWEIIRSPLSGNNTLTATVSGSTATFSAPDAAKISVADLKLETALYWGETCKISFSVTNSGKSEFYDGLIPVLISADGTSLVAQGATYPIDVLAGATEQAEYIGTFTAETTPAAGTYLLGICDPSGRLVCSPIEVQLNSTPAATTLTVSNLKMLSENPFRGEGNAVFQFTVTCTEGYYADKLTLAIFHASGGASITSGSTDVLYLGAGDSSTQTVELDLGELSTGSYMAAVFNGSEQLSSPVDFNVDTALGLTEIGSGQWTADNEIYDLSGRKVTSPRRGMYIVNGKIRCL